MRNIFLASRPFNLFFLLVAQILASYFLGFGNQLGDVFNRSHLLVYSTTLLCAAFGYLSNDWLDIKADQINRPQSNYLNTPQLKLVTLVLIILLAIAAILLAILVSIWYVKVIGCILLILLAYNRFLKKIPLFGNSIIALLGAFAILILLAFDSNLKQELILIFSINAFGIHLIREVIKDAQDVKGDTEVGYTTFPVVVGLKATRTVLIVMLFIYILVFTTCVRIMLLHYFTPPFSYVFLSYNILCIGVPLFHLLSKLQSNNPQIDYAYLNQVALYIMMTGTSMMLFF